jgi:peptidoglycan/xylan/chitin deacetylase (PgdA/CDA1 family)
MIATSITPSRVADDARARLHRLMRSPLPDFRARLSNRLARHFLAAPLRLPGDRPMVSFTFDDVPDSAVTVGAGMLEDHGGRGTFYISGSLVAERSEHWTGAGTDDIIELHREGHEIGCHTFSHRRAIELDTAAMNAEIAANRRFFHTLDPSIRLANFAYPYGLACVTHKPRLRHAFSSARGILPGVNSGVVDLQFLRAVPLIECGITRDGVERAFDKAESSSGWLIFYSHDVARSPSPYGCSPGLLHDALQAAVRRRMPIVTVAEALRRAGYNSVSDRD